MEARAVLSVACLAAWASLASPARGGLVVTPDKENVVASRLAGRLTIGGKSYPFILIEHKGNPYLCCFRERDGDPMGDGESLNVMLAVAKDRANDLLFIGGDFNNQPFSGYERADRHDGR